ncbi:MAG: 30S ribosomal protein S17 [Candidatus Koribacter versatilis]|uniref:Small ribosomal subunit protein uS17 n=1 Tax=Candidatus Korobacter versatilis TaxID=658062 RepID=A0A932AAD0_9BACT|nr:30S ribosomal protein S17 [Candidatus Koribacter versatilis]
MTSTSTAAAVADNKKSDRNTKMGRVVSTKMAKTIVVETTRQRAHALYKRVITRSKRFYAHDEQGTARLGDFVEIEETRPMSKLKRWRLKNVIQRSALVEEPISGKERAAAAKGGPAQPVAENHPVAEKKTEKKPRAKKNESAS